MMLEDFIQGEIEQVERRIECSVDTSKGDLIGDLDDEDVGFLCAVLNTSVGGQPALGTATLTKDEGLEGVLAYTLVSTCECDKCEDFRKQYPAVAGLTVVRAARRYVENRMEYLINSAKSEKANVTCH